MESVHIVRMKSSDPCWPSKEISVLLQKQMRKVPDQRTKVVWQGHFALSRPRGTFRINIKCQNLWFKLCLSILIAERILKTYIIFFFFLGRCDEKLTEWHPDQWNNGQNVELHPTFWGLGVVLQVSNMNERLMESAFQHIIKKIISYLIGSQLNQVVKWNLKLFGESPIYAKNLTLASVTFFFF